MWEYTCITRENFELVKDKIENFIVLLGGKKAQIELPYEQKTTSVFENNTIFYISTRPIFEYKKKYYRVCEVCFPVKPFIVIECGTYDELINNILEDMDPFPYDLTDDELLNEVKYSLGIEVSPENY